MTSRHVGTKRGGNWRRFCIELFKSQRGKVIYIYILICDFDISFLIFYLSEIFYKKIKILLVIHEYLLMSRQRTNGGAHDRKNI